MSASRTSLGSQAQPQKFTQEETQILHSAAVDLPQGLIAGKEYSRSTAIIPGVEVSFIVTRAVGEEVPKTGILAVALPNLRDTAAPRRLLPKISAPERKKSMILVYF